MLTGDRIVIWDEPVSREEVLRSLVESVAISDPHIVPGVILKKLSEREAQGSTFLNEGVALPHARIEGLAAPQIALGITRAGVQDAPTDKPIEAIFLLLSPAKGNTHLQLLAKAARTLQSRDLRKDLYESSSAEGALAAIQDFEAATSGGRH